VHLVGFITKKFVMMHGRSHERKKITLHKSGVQKFGVKL